jgi:phosphoglycolate phosphatase-like HAD superfamily hydrolase
VTHLVWDWNGTLLDDLDLAVVATNVALAAAGGPQVTADQHRRDFCRPISAYYGRVLGRTLAEAEFTQLDRLFHDAYRAGLPSCRLAADAGRALAAWAGTQSLLSMYFHAELVAAVGARGIGAHLVRIDGLRELVGGGPKAPHLRAHLVHLALAPADVVLIGDSVDDADAAVEVGARVVLYDGGFTHTDRLRATGHRVASTLGEAVRLAAQSVDGP